jgi:hypothetical protein
MQIEEHDGMPENLGEVVENQQPGTDLVCRTHNQIKSFLIERKFQQEDLLDAFVSDDAIKHRHVQDPRDMQNLRFLVVLIRHGTFDPEPESSGFVDPIGNISSLFNRTDQQRSLSVFFGSKKMVRQLPDKEKVANQQVEVKNR